ncbi:MULTISPECIES: bile acid:sodium symporter family protein [unclassified Gilliamella]|uniref:bile acid:sodium symporter family protein n=1 Tax=unclassified Gilliamella TaxID=2685620 RepID=UPI00226AD2E4|nr:MULTISPECIES: bile acid:sodium symporter family protein [unclassified Gilliamella]MCX8642088.1 bile acid:sodium symporter [Gilliamella sp. B3835]MCX8707274.1 bile acid:sodium symporter [Gilliamella sp. B3783]MCX8710817.1 bile acid:sodium symporter [Gilliamella sp. B3780]MCX8711818.1 bile acid:sodium symporter [Gilliamella sp. B3468]MCX8713985.1 bile acid:sodium symporter [Gilliamella sp. B3781]
MNILQRFKIDPFLLTLICVVITASFFPCEGQTKVVFQYLTTFAIGLLFFMHGAKLSLDAIITGIKNWRLHLFIFSTTFIIFPVLGIMMHFLVPTFLSQELYQGFVYLCVLPATVQSAIAFTSIARGNVAAAICSASASTLLGVFITPILVGLLMNTQSSGSMSMLDAISSIMLKLMLPFILGHLSRRFIGKWVDKYKSVISKTDRISILLVVYVAFSDAVANGIWSEISLLSLVQIIFYSIVLLTIVLLITTYGSRLLGFNKEDEITIVFCGSKKSLASGIPMASVIFPISVMGIMILPLMIFHQVQLMICAVLAARYAKRKI